MQTNTKIVKCAMEVEGFAHVSFRPCDSTETVPTSTIAFRTKGYVLFRAHSRYLASSTQPNCEGIYECELIMLQISCLTLRRSAIIYAL